MRYGTRLIIFISLIPFIDLNLRAFGIYGGLGANPVETMIHTSGIWGLRVLIATLMLNGYADAVGHLYSNLDLKKYF